MTHIVIPFHTGDQFSAQLLMENILSFDSGMDDKLKFRLQFDRPRNECRILDTIDRLGQRFSVDLVEHLPDVPVPDVFREDDPNSERIDERHTVRTPETKERILSWNRAVFSAIQDIDLFAIIEPDCIILKDGWAKDVFDAAANGLANFPIFGHLKTGLIGGRQIPTHFAGCSVYDGKTLRQLITDEVFLNRYPNPWWKLRQNEPTELAGNCFWGPVFSGFDISFDYFLYGHLQRDRHAHDRALEWETSDLTDGQDVILCDFHSRKTIDEIFSNFFGRQPVIHGIKDDAIRHAIIKRARGGLTYPGFSLSGPSLEAAYDHETEALQAQVSSGPPGAISAANDRFCTLEALKDQFKGERVFLMANGPSLRKTDLTRLKNEYTIGLNRIGLNLENMGFQPTFLCCVNANVLEQFSDDFSRSSSIKFLSAKAEGKIPNSWNTFFMGSLPKVGYFEKDLTKQEWCEGWTVTYCAMQVAYFLGFEEVVLVGLDHYFKDSGAANKAVVADGADENHFHPAYFGKGVTWQYPDLDRSEQHYLVAREVFEAEGRKILDATLGGHCTIFDKIDLERVLPKLKPEDLFNKPQVSIVIPFWNEERYIEEAIQSILDENLSSFEIVCVDDRSDDASVAVVRRLMQKYEQIRLVTNSGKGVSDARNTGMAFTTGEFVAFLDADDVVKPGSLGARIAALNSQQDWNMVHGHVAFTGEHGEDLGCGMGLPRSVSFTDASVMPAHFNTVMVRRSVLHDLSFPSGVKNGEDWRAFAGFLRHGHRSHFVELPGGLATYRIHPRSTVLKDYPKHEESLQSVLSWVFSPVNDGECASDFENGLDVARLPDIQERRQASLMIWEMFKGQTASALNVAEALAESNLSQGDAWQSLIPNLEVSGVRYFGVHKDALDQLGDSKLMPLRRSLEAVAQQLGPEIYAPFEAVFGLSNEASAQFEFPRERGARVDETEVIAHLLNACTGRSHTMIDVGAHFGTSAQFFHDLDWTIHCFEPDPKNRAKLLDRFRSAENVVIDNRAVSDEPATNVQFFSSQQSTGISGLHAFHESHAEAGLVDITTLRDIIADRNIQSVDFLKIDVEGFDLNVLKGVPWATIQPDVIECEFEDAKTLKLGHTWQDIADYLEDKGYFVYVSEWHPIVRYGIPHDWRRVFKYPSIKMKDDAWGNLLAFRQDPGLANVSNAFSKVMKYRSKSKSAATPITSQSQASIVQSSDQEKIKNNTAQAKQLDVSDDMNQNADKGRVGMLKQTPGFDTQRILDEHASPGTAWYSSIAHKIRARSPAAFDFLRFVRRYTVRYLRSPVWLGLMALTIAGVAWLGLSSSLEGQRMLIVTFVAFLIIAGLLILIAHRSQFHAEQLYLKNMKMQRDVNALSGRLANAQILIAHEAREQMLDHVQTVLNSTILPKLEAVPSITDELATLKTEGKRNIESVDEALNSLKQSNLLHREDVSKSIGRLSEAIDRLQQLQDTTNLEMRSELGALNVGLQSQMDATNLVDGVIDTLKTELEALTHKSLLGDQFREDVQSRVESIELSAERLETSNSLLQTEISSIRSDVDAKLEKTSGDLGKAHEETTERLRQIESTLKGQVDSLESTLVSRISDATEDMNAVSLRMNEAESTLKRSQKWAMHDNAAWFQHFNRELRQEHIDVFRKDWQKKLSLKLAPQTLGYMAARACEIERKLDGRVATSIEDMLLRTCVAKAVKDKEINVLEIGTLFGAGAAIIHDALKPHFDKIHLSLLDPLEGYYNRSEPDILTGQIVDEATIRRNFERVGIADDEFTLIKRLSTAPEAIVAAEKKQYDLLIIDGDHSFAGVKADFENYAPFVKLGGYVIFDDYGSPDWPDIQSYVDSEMANHSWIARVGASWHTGVFRVVKPIK